MAKKLFDSFSFEKNDYRHMIHIYSVREHYEIYVDDEFWCSCDNRNEVDEEIEYIYQNVM